jgi:catechol 2,3-dioxygenase-like lactoylglutathione lyase family enzyme
MIQHLTREVPPTELDACARFYSRLGFNEVPAPPGIAGRALWLQAGPTQIHLMPRDDARPQSGHVGIVLERYSEVLEQLRAEGHEINPRREHWGSPRAYVSDPFGNLVEVMEFPPPTTPALQPEPQEVEDG